MTAKANLHREIQLLQQPHLDESCPSAPPIVL